MQKQPILKRESTAPHPILMAASPRTAGTPSLASSPSKPSNAHQLVVGADVKLRCAEISDCDVLIVEGLAEASITSERLEIAEGGHFSGKVCIDVGEIHGEFEGEMEVRQQLVIHPSGCVRGKVRYAKLLIHEGGQLSGEIARLSSDHHQGDAL